MTKEATRDDLIALEKLEKEASAPPWRVEHDINVFDKDGNVTGMSGSDTDKWDKRNSANAKFSTRVRNLTRGILALLDRLMYVESYFVEWLPLTQRPCPLCKYEDGKFRSACRIHEHLASRESVTDAAGMMGRIGANCPHDEDTKKDGIRLCCSKCAEREFEVVLKLAKDWEDKFEKGDAKRKKALEGRRDFESKLVKERSDWTKINKHVRELEQENASLKAAAKAKK